MEVFETICAFFLSSSLYRGKGRYLFAHFEILILTAQHGRWLSAYDRLYPLKPKNPI